MPAIPNVTSPTTARDLITTDSSKVSASATDQNTLGKDAFRKLLVAQLKYQTADSPMDSSQFMAQTAQFSQLEAIQNMQKAQTNALTAQQSALATNMLG